ncbi:hypothetical protein MHBO_003960 [Bonamia ostreae]|uniref:Uncharacterized protein n=1 Tax=Bonamia ostreae TaxID=126728 RepID=A0ABV2ARZ5_9EUKA
MLELPTDKDGRFILARAGFRMQKEEPSFLFAPFRTKNDDFDIGFEDLSNLTFMTIHSPQNFFERNGLTDLAENLKNEIFKSFQKWNFLWEFDLKIRRKIFVKQILI